MNKRLSHDHKVWKGKFYDAGFQGIRLLIVGFSHHGPDDQEDDAFTKDLMSAVKAGHIAFFNQIAGYLGRDSTDGFWDEVAFANTLPNLVGSSDSRYDLGSSQQRAAVPARIKNIVANLNRKRLLFLLKRAGTFGRPSTA